MKEEMTDREKLRVERKRERDMRTVSQMIAIYCEGVHGERERGHVSIAGEPLCADCAKLDEYTAARTRSCPLGQRKTTCSRCTVHCYAKGRREQVREVMRYAGPRMLKKHPIAAFRHLIGS